MNKSNEISGSSFLAVMAQRFVVITLAAAILTGCTGDDPLSFGIDDSSLSAKSAINGTWDFHYGEVAGASPAFAIRFDRGEAVEFEFPQTSDSEIRTIPLNGEPVLSSDDLSAITMTGELTREADEYVVNFSIDVTNRGQLANSSSAVLRVRLAEDGVLRGTINSTDGGEGTASAVVGIRR